MQQLSLELHRCIWPGILLFGVLAGLLFSCGEGIRLFPFPQAETTAETSFTRKSEEKILYQKNVHRFETKQENQSKSQRDSPNRYGAGLYHTLNASPFMPSANLVKTGFPHGFQAAKSFESIGSSGGSRAPPVSESL